MDKLIFVTGTGTDVGKTVISAALATGLTHQGHRVTYWKPVQSGLPQDASQVKRWVPGSVVIQPSSATYKMPASPDQAARAEGLEGVTVAQLLRDSQVLKGERGIVEGAGGLMVPLNNQGETWADFLRETQMPTLVVAATGLGTLNHTVLTIEALRNRHIPVLGVVLCGAPHPENLKSLGVLLPEIRFFHFPELEGVGTHPVWRDHAQELIQFIEQA